MFYVGTDGIGVFPFIKKVSPEQRPYKDADQLYLYCNKEKELPEQSGDWRHICTEQF